MRRRRPGRSIPPCEAFKARPRRATGEGQRRTPALGTLTTNVRRLKSGERSATARIANVERECESARLSSHGAFDARGLGILMVSLIPTQRRVTIGRAHTATAVLDEVQGEWEWVTKPDVWRRVS